MGEMISWGRRGDEEGRRAVEKASAEVMSAREREREIGGSLE
jgi:hypothetical protein